MATNSKVADDSSTPPSYDTILASPIQCDKSSIYIFGLMKKKRAAVLSRIRDIVLAPDFIPSSVVPNVNACAAALPATEFSKILTQLNIEGHTALYWAIVNNRPQALWTFINSILETTSVRDAFLDVYQMTFRIFQKRLRTYKSLHFEFVAGGRIWWFRFDIPESSNGSCRAVIGLNTNRLALVPWQSPEGIEYEPPPEMAWNIWNEVGDWVLHNNTEYVDDEGTLHAKLQMTLL
ncbi:hypothetical protein C8R48DRAFT_679173 [Suillus tomentosus]|nr:hypothetical protein C8R48DRAFT_679173 [Suillus tomentosus]